MKHFSRLVPADAFRSCDQFFRHDARDRLAQLIGKTQITIGDDALQLVVVIHHRNARDIVLLGEEAGGFYGLILLDGDGVPHHASFVFLDEADLLGLFLRGEIFMNHPNSPRLRHADGKTGFGDGVHRRRCQRHIQGNTARKPTANVGVFGQNGGMARQQQHIVKGERKFWIRWCCGMCHEPL